MLGPLRIYGIFFQHAMSCRYRHQEPRNGCQALSKQKVLFCHVGFEIGQKHIITMNVDDLRNEKGFSAQK
jgi:hypothetical protein